MINLKTKGGQKLLTAGNWAWSIFTINFAWFLINFSVILTAIILGSINLSVSFVMINLILTFMLAIFTIPSLMASFKTVQDWQINGNASYFKKQFANWIQMLKNFKLNVGFAFMFGVLIKLNNKFLEFVFPHMFVLTTTVIVIALLITESFQIGTNSDESFIELCLDHPVKILGATAIFIALLILNLVLQLAFLIVICSISLSVYFTYRLFGGRVEKND